MKIYWSNKDVPELANLTPKQQQKIWKDCYFKYAFKYWQVWASLIFLGFLVAVGNGGAGILGAAIGGGLGGFVFYQVVTNILRPHLQEYINSQLPQDS